MTRTPLAAFDDSSTSAAAASAGLTPAQNAALFVARIGLASLFLFSGAEKLTSLQGAIGWAASHGVPLAPLVMPLAALFEIGAGLMLVTGWRAREAAAALAAWIFVLGPIFHQFWNAPPESWQVSIDDFFHHWVMFGGMVYVVIFGPGAWALARRKARSRP
ncbi:MAG: putative oxidoreductase [Sphingomonadales bacterium]|jgi:putative oxidoreductase|nr:putative oxidoreductase [Sphingomonadales bacterium]